MSLESWENILSEFEGKDDLLEFYLESDEEGLLVGRICKVFDEFDDDEDEIYEESSVIISVFTPEGEEDGLIWLPVSNLSMICYDTQYLREFKELVKDTEAASYPDNGAWGLDALLELSCREKKVLSLDTGFEEAIIYGIVREHSESFIRLECILESGEYDGVCLIEKDRVEVCQYQGIDEKACRSEE